MKKPKIAPELSNLKHVRLGDLVPFQGDLKQLSSESYAKLKRSIDQNGIFVPFFVWDAKNAILDGHQRERVLVTEGFQDLMVPVLPIAAKSEAEARKKLLLISSQFGRITEHGLASFTVDLPEDWLAESVNFDGISTLDFDFDLDEIPKEIGTEIADDVAMHQCPECGHQWPM